MKSEKKKYTALGRNAVKGPLVAGLAEGPRRRHPTNQDGIQGPPIHKAGPVRIHYVTIRPSRHRAASDVSSQAVAERDHSP